MMRKKEKVKYLYLKIFAKAKERAINNIISKSELNFVLSFIKIICKDEFNLIIHEMISCGLIRKTGKENYLLNEDYFKLLKMLDNHSRLYHYVGCW